MQTRFCGVLERSQGRSTQLLPRHCASRAEMALQAYRLKCPKHQMIADVWERTLERVIPLFELPEEIRKIIPIYDPAARAHGAVGPRSVKVKIFP